MNFNVQPSCKILPCVACSQKLFHLWIYQRILHEIHRLKQYCWRLSSTAGLHRLSWWNAEIPRKVHAGCRWIKMYVILMYHFYKSLLICMNDSSSSSCYHMILSVGFQQTFIRLQHNGEPRKKIDLLARGNLGKNVYGWISESVVWFLFASFFSRKFLRVEVNSDTFLWEFGMFKHFCGLQSRAGQSLPLTV